MVNYRKVTLTAMTTNRLTVKGALSVAPALLSTSHMLTKKPKKVSLIIVVTITILFYGINMYICLKIN